VQSAAAFSGNDTCSDNWAVNAVRDDANHDCNLPTDRNAASTSTTDAAAPSARTAAICCACWTTVEVFMVQV
jgi:hypothetical protein